MQKILVAAILLLSLSFISCRKNRNVRETNATVKDMTGLDGCGLMIELDNGERLEPVSLPSGTTLIAGRRVHVKYEVVKHASVCMAGATAKITALQYL